MLVDSHCHLDFPDFAQDLAGVIERAKAAGVGTMLTIGTHLTKARPVIGLAEHYPEIFATVGIHPHEAAREPKTDADALIALAVHPKVVGFGESGLDYFYEHSPRAAQQENFRTHIAAARKSGLPLVIHSRDADDDTIAILEEEMVKGAFRGLIHCFSSGPKLAETAIRLGLYVSFSGIVTFKKSEPILAIAAQLPLDRILVETDAPFLAPVPKRGKRNEPAFVAQVAAKIAQARGLGLAEFAKASSANFFRLFVKAQPA
ncbi:MAG: TatD family hydrolase [Rhodospirillales bacterium]|nr:TatD family hydrolase [Rhodospirillales bacterium]